MPSLENGVQSGPKEQQDPSHPAKKAIVIAVTIVCLLAVAAAVTCFVVVFYVRTSNSSSRLYDVQVSGSERLTVYDSERGVWRFVCSSPRNNDVARLGCEQMGFVRWVWSCLVSL
ncbi:serine protease hepsin-like [Hemitrygon akajei]|uniref:serine protease hepsin-like n=1 Tax=Hemitrygon akajei TaxID=2704970 RepID=UPI003BFA219C